jgi:hypothetical protein
MVSVSWPQSLLCVANMTTVGSSTLVAWELDSRGEGAERNPNRGLVELILSLLFEPDSPGEGRVELTCHSAAFFRVPPGG